MASPYLGEIRIVGFNFAPRGWMFCNGALLPISSYTALFSLLGTTYGGNGTSNFGLPDYQNRAPMMWGQGPGLSDYVIGEEAGETTVTVLSTEMPVHSHTLEQATLTTQNPPQNSASPTSDAYFGISGPGALYSTVGSNTTLSPYATTLTGGSQPHNNRSPLLGVYFIICASGIYPQRA
jgi:microcystin-dependent protein